MYLRDLKFSQLTPIIRVFVYSIKRVVFVMKNRVLLSKNLKFKYLYTLYQIYVLNY